MVHFIHTLLATGSACDLFLSDRMAAAIAFQDHRYYNDRGACTYNLNYYAACQNTE
jgi:hypothetical protein